MGIGQFTSVIFLTYHFMRSIQYYLSYEKPIAYDRPTIMPILPGVNFPVRYFFMFWISTLFTVIIHELGHAHAALIERLQLQGYGIFVSFIFPGAYVRMEDIIQFLPSGAQLRVYSAGVWNNVMAVLFLWLLISCQPYLLSLFYVQSHVGPLILSMDPKSPLYSVLHAGDIIHTINNQPIISKTDLFRYMNLLKQQSISQQLSTTEIKYLRLKYLSNIFKNDSNNAPKIHRMNNNHNDNNQGHDFLHLEDDPDTSVSILSVTAGYGVCTSRELILAQSTSIPYCCDSVLHFQGKSQSYRMSCFLHRKEQPISIVKNKDTEVNTASTADPLHTMDTIPGRGPKVRNRDDESVLNKSERTRRRSAGYTHDVHNTNHRDNILVASPVSDIWDPLTNASLYTDHRRPVEGGSNQRLQEPTVALNMNTQEHNEEMDLYCLSAKRLYVEGLRSNGVTHSSAEVEVEVEMHRDSKKDGHKMMDQGCVSDGDCTQSLDKNAQGSGSGSSSRGRKRHCLKPLTIIPTQLMKIEIWRAETSKEHRLTSEGSERSGMGGEDWRQEWRLRNGEERKEEVVRSSKMTDSDSSGGRHTHENRSFIRKLVLYEGNPTDITVSLKLGDLTLRPWLTLIVEFILWSMGLASGRAREFMYGILLGLPESTYMCLSLCLQVSIFSILMYDSNVVVLS